MQQYEEETRTRLMDTKPIWSGKDDGEKSGSAAFGFWLRLPRWSTSGDAICSCVSNSCGL